MARTFGCVFSRILLVVAWVLAGLPARAAVDSWVDLGGQPGKGGLIRGILSFPGTTGGPRILYAATPDGGVFKNTDGNSWQASNNGLPSSRALTLAGVSSSQLLVGLDGHGIYQTTDGGANWAALGTGLGCGSVRAIAIVSAFSSGVAYAGTDCKEQSGLYKTTDKGATWSLLTAGLGNLTIYQILFNGTTLIITTKDKGVYVSADGGATWASGNGTGSTALTAVDGRTSAGFYRVIGSTHFTVVFGSGLFKSIDSGATWNQLSGLPSSNIIGLAAFSASNLMATADGYGAYTSTDGGTSWTPYNDTAAGNPAMRFIVGDSTALYSATFAGIFRCADLTSPFPVPVSCWTPFSNGLGGGHVRSVVVDPANANIAYATADTHYKSTDAGNTWTRLGGIPGVTTDVGSVRIDPTNNAILYAATDYAGIFKSSDSGATWTAINTGLPALALQAPYLALDRRSSGTVYVGLKNDGVYRSTDGGSSWSAINNGLSGDARRVHSVEVDPSNPSLLLAATATGLFRSTDAGNTWAAAFSVSSPGGTALDFAFITADRATPGTYYAVARGRDASGTPYPASGVYRSADYGLSWTPLLIGRWVWLVRSTHSSTGVNALYVTVADSAGEGVRRSLDDGQTWSSVDSGLPSRGIFNIVCDASCSQLAYATVFGGGVFRFAPAPVAAVLPTALTIIAPATLQSGGSAALGVTASYSDGSTKTVAAAWTTSNPALTSISAAGVLSAGSVTSDTSVTLTASYREGDVSVTASQTVSISATPATLASLALSGGSSVSSGGLLRLKATASYSDGSSRPVAATSWSVSPSALGSVNSRGELTAAAAASDTTLTVTASYSENGITQSATLNITVKATAATLTSLGIVAAEGTLAAGKMLALAAESGYSDGSNKRVNATWSLSSSIAASVDANGLVTAKSVTVDTPVVVTATYSEGSNTATAKYQIIVQPAAITVTPAPLAAEVIVTNTTQNKTRLQLWFNTNSLATTRARASSPLYKLYIAALVPAGPLVGTPSYFMLNRSQEWTPLAWPLAEYLSGLNAGEWQLIELIDNIDASLISGTQIFVGYGESDTEMLAAGRYRVAYQVP